MKLLKILAVAAAMSSPVQASVYTDDLSRCLVERSTTEDKFALVKWMFAAASRHPAVGDIANLSEQEAEQISRDAADLFVRLVSEVCREETRRAVKYDGASAIESAFEVLGQVAGTELFSTPEVIQSLGQLESFIDADKLERVFQ
ncbi:hypothetical protein KUV56_05075 [Ferrimonas balearica]|uniref:hypothetical protein n=1 Tax=Ferrimonas balearica TaxID=44012 RepID=UPI001C586E02|nr:hypothetical protein [Ferrimonas balearica]MBW3138905.1 hypothetical protein [Ferrimonas balearica]